MKYCVKDETPCFLIPIPILYKETQPPAQDFVINDKKLKLKL